MNIQKHILKFTAIYVPLSCILVGAIFFTIDIIYLGHGNSDKFGGRIEAFEMAMIFHIFTAISFSVGCFISTLVFRKWLSTLKLSQLLFFEFLPSMFLLFIIANISSYFWGVFGGGLLISALSGFLTRCFLGFIVCIFIFQSGKILVKINIIKNA